MDVRAKTATFSIIVNIILIAFKFLLWRISGSTSIHADAWHSISDLCVSGLVLAGLYLSSPGESKAPVNWRGFEDLIALLVGAFIVYTGISILKSSFMERAQTLTNVGWAIGGALVCILISNFIATIKIKVGEETGSSSLLADGYHSRMDVYSTVAVAVGLFGVLIGIELDRLAAGVVSIFIVLTGVEIIAGSIKAMLKGTPVTDFFLSRLFELGQREGITGKFWNRLWLLSSWLGNRRRALILSLVVIAVIWLSSAFYIVRYGEQALVLRFGRLSRVEALAGLHIHAPFPIERTIIIPTDRIFRVEIGFRTVSGRKGDLKAYEWESRHLAGSYEKRLDESLVFTGDENIIDLNTVVQYRISKPVDFFFNVEDREVLVRSSAEASLRSLVSTMTIDALLTTQRALLEGQLNDHLQALLDSASSGLEVVAVKLQDVHPPYEVVSAFREVASAREDMNRIINQALAYQDSLIPEVRGLARKLILEAIADSTERVERAHGEAKKFLEVVKEYRRSKEVTGVRMYLETMEKILPGLEKFIVEPEASKEALDLRFIEGAQGELKGVW